MTDAKIVSVHGGRVPGQPDPGVLEDLERLLTRAKRGELLGVAYATVSEDLSQSTGWAGAAGSRHPLGTAIMMLNHRYSSALLSGE